MRNVILLAALALGAGCATVQPRASADTTASDGVECHLLPPSAAAHYKEIDPLRTDGPAQVMYMHEPASFITTVDGNLYECPTRS